MQIEKSQLNAEKPAGHIPARHGSHWKTKLLQSVSGVGPAVAQTLIAAVPELRKVSKKQIAALIGVAPINRDSGRMRGRRSTWGGPSQVRTILYMAHVIGHSEQTTDPGNQGHHLLLVCRDQARVKGACVRKLLVMLNAILKHGTPRKAIELLAV